MIETVFGVLVLGGALAGALWFSKQQGAWAAAGAQGMGGDHAAMTRWMFQRTGFQLAALRGAPLEAQVEQAMRQAGQPLNETHLVRTTDGFEFHFVQRTAMTPSGGVSMSARWSTPAAPPFGLHVADRRLTSVGQAMVNALTNLSREFTPLYPNEVGLADPELAARFRVWSSDPAQAVSYLARPALRHALLALPSVDFVLSPSEISLADPLMENLTGGRPAASLVGMPVQAIVEAQAQGHDAVARLFAAALGRA